ncbi:MAG: hypothetical protein JWQ43_452 [Glaciihabitans sp.]|nr:hypothetical protein [Glaciihabitans sp.]
MITTTPASVYQRVLGADFDKLSPEIADYFALPPEPDMVGRVSGVFHVAGSRRAWLRPLLHFLAWRRVMFPEFNHDVPFRAINIPGPGDGLSSLREIELPGTLRLIEDTMHVIDGRLHIFVGRKRGAELRLRLRVVDGGLSTISDGLWIHIGGQRIRIPKVFGAKVVASQHWAQSEHQVVVTVSNPLVGDLFEYAGSFRYRFE